MAQRHGNSFITVVNWPNLSFLERNLAMNKMFIFVKSVVSLLGMYPKKVIPRKETKLKLCVQRCGMQRYLSEKSRRKLQKYSIPRDTS